MYHVSDLKRFQRCPKLYYLMRNEGKSSRIDFVRVDEAVSILGAKKLGIKTAFVGKTGDSNEVSFKGMNDYKWLIKSRFEYDELRVKIPFLQKTEEGWNAYFIHVGIFPRDNHLEYYAMNLWVLGKLGIKVNRVYVIHFNKEYIREGDLNYNKLLTVSDCFYNQSHNPSKNITEAWKAWNYDYEKNLTCLKGFQIETFQTERKAGCHRRMECPYYNHCFDNHELSDDSILFLMAFTDKYKFYQKGYRHFDDLPLTKIDLSKQQYAQIMAHRNGGLFLDKAALRFWMKEHIVTPVSFLDFEWDTYAIPPYHKMAPFQVLPFQYSLHVLEEELKHYEYIGFEDCREAFIKHLLSSLPKEGSILAYNAEGGEVLRLEELKRDFPAYAKEIEGIINRLVDISIPYSLGMVYSTKMRGNYSIKSILPTIDYHLDYDNLDIGKAMDAVTTWRTLTKEEIDHKVVDDLLAYCAMDTYALYVLYEWLKQKVLKEGENA